VPPPIATARMLERSVLRRAGMAFARLGLAKVGDRDFTIMPSQS
jgi:hypothetical protein